MPEKEFRLIQRARAGDALAFVEIYDRYQPAVYRYAFYQLGDAAAAERLTEEVFTQLVERIDALPSEGRSLPALLYSLARERIAAFQSRAVPPLPSSLAEQADADEAGLEPFLEDRLTPQGLAAVLAALPEEQRSLVLLRFIEGMDRREAARVLGKPVEAVDTIAQHALPALATGIAWWTTTQAPSSSRQQTGEELERLQAELVQSLTHELRTPLSLIHGYTELLLSGAMGPVHPMQRDALEVIHERTTALSRLIRDLTALRTIPQGVMARVPVSLHEIIERTLTDYRRAAGQTGVRLEVEIPDDLPPLLGDREYLALAFSHLLDNAIKFSPDGGRVRVRAWTEGQWLHVAVEDEGIGIEPGHLNRVFDRFYQVDSSTTRRFNGLGLGLTIVRAVVEAHGGRVRAASEGLGKGSTFTVTLPTRFPGCPSPLWDSAEEQRWRQGLARALEDCLPLLEQGETSLEECLARYPEYADDLRPLLKVALGVRRAPRLASSPVAFAAGRRRMLQALAERERHPVSPLVSLRRRVGRRAAALLEGGGGRPVFRPAGLPLALATALAVVLLAVGGFSFIHEAEATVDQKAVLDQVDGVVEVLPTGSDVWRQVSAGEEVRAGDRVRTGPSSSATLVFFDGSVTVLEARTRVTLVQLSSRQDGGGRVIVLHQWLGRTFSHVQHLPDRASRFEVESPTAMMAVRGTRFVVAVEDDGTTNVVVLDGSVSVTAQKTTVSVLAGQGTTVWPERPPVPVQLVSIPTPMAWFPLRRLHPLEDTRPPIPSPTPTTVPPTLVIVPTDTATPLPTPTRVMPVPTRAPTRTPVPTNTPVPSPTLLPPTSTPSRPTPTAAPTWTPTGTPTPTSTWTPTATPTGTLTPTPTITGTLTPTTTPLPSGTSTPEVPPVTEEPQS